MFGFGTTELVLILVIILIIFGAGKLPEIGSAMGKAIKSFKKSVHDTEIDITPKGDKDGLDSGAKDKSTVASSAASNETSKEKREEKTG